MCIGVWTLEHPDYALILCTNRDEYLDRPTQDAHFHSFQADHYRENPSSVSGNILSGRDDKAGGSWFGINRAGKVALLTNITEPPKSFTSSRGYLVSLFLLSDSSQPLEDEVWKIVSQDAEFAGFNLLLLAPAPHSTTTVPIEPEPKAEEAVVNSREEKLIYDAILVTNHGAGGPLQGRRLVSAERACGCMSNGVDGQGGNEWPKVKRASKDFREVVKAMPTDGLFAQTEHELINHLFRVLTWRSPDPITQRSELRNTVQVSPIPIVLPPSVTKVPDVPLPNDLSGPAITTPTPSTATPDLSDPKKSSVPVPPSYKNYYGTRLSTVLLIRRDGSVLFIERDIWRLGKDGKPKRLDDQESRGEGDTKERVFEFKLDRIPR